MAHDESYSPWHEQALDIATYDAPQALTIARRSHEIQPSCISYNHEHDSLILSEEKGVETNERGESIDIADIGWPLALSGYGFVS